GGPGGPGLPGPADGRAARGAGAMPPGGGFGAGGGGRAGLGGPGFGPAAGGDLRMRAAMPAPPAEPFIIREYSHVVPARAEGQARDDFAETVYWHPALVLNEDGKASISFQVSDAVTRYRVLAAGHTLDGRLGSHKHEIEARKPFSVE